MKVKAKSKGFLGGVRRRPGDVFECKKSQFSARWMEEVKKAGRPKKEEVKEGPKEEPKELIQVLSNVQTED